MRASAAVIFRRVASKARKDPASNDSKELFLTLSNDAKVPIRSGLLQCLASEQVSHVRNKVGDAIAEIARQYTDNSRFDLATTRLVDTVDPFNVDEQWPELLSALFQSSQSPDPNVRECAFRIFTTTPGIIERQHENVVQEVFGKAFRDDSVNVCKNCEDQVDNRNADMTTGQIGGYRSIRRILQLDHKEVPSEVLPAHSRGSECSPSSKRFERSGQLIESLRIAY